MAGRVDRVLNAALAGDKAAALNVPVAELLAEPEAVAVAIATVLDGPGVGVLGHWKVHNLLRRSTLDSQLLDALTDPRPETRAAAARICGAARLTDSVAWISDLLDDPIPKVRDAAIRSLAQLGGRRAVEELVASADKIPLHRLAIAVAQAASDMDAEALMRKPATEEIAVATVLACGLRRDVLRVSPLLGIAHDRRWPAQVRRAACKALAMIGDRSAADGLHRLADQDPDPEIKAAAGRAYKRLLKRAVAGRR